MATTVPGIRVLPAPESEPPYQEMLSLHAREGQHGKQPRGRQGSLALAFELPSGAPATPRPPAALRQVAPAGGSAGIDSGDPLESRKRQGSASVRPWACKFVQALVEVLYGARPVTQLLQWTTPEVYEAVKRRAALPGGWPGDVTAPRRSRVHSVRVSQPRDGITEVCAVVGGGERAHAMALRLEGSGRRWRCTELQLG